MQLLKLQLKKRNLTNLDLHLMQMERVEKTQFMHRFYKVYQTVRESPQKCNEQGVSKLKI